MLGTSRVAATHTFEPKNSSNVAKVEYHAAKSELHVTFKNGASHAYQDVPLGIFHEMQKAPSAGKFFATSIKPKFKSRKLGT